MSSLNELAKSRTKYFLAVAAAFFLYQLYLLVNSFSAVSRIYERVFLDQSANPSFWSLVWFSSEFIGEIGLIARFSGACFLVAFLSIILVRRKLAFSFLRKAVLLEGLYYLFILPFIVYMLTRPYESTAGQLVNAEAALSYILQIILVSPTFFVLYKKLRRTQLDVPEVVRLGAIGVVGFTFALWVKHFLLNLYALPIDLNEGILLFGFLNSALTLLIAACLLLAALFPVIGKKSVNFDTRIAATGLVLIGTYFLVYIAVAFLNQGYMSFLGLSEIWAISMPIAGVGLILQEK